MKNKLYYVERLVVEVKDGNQQSFSDNPTKPLADYRNVERFVLLGEPGAGKTTCFQRENEQHADALFIPARDFIDLVKTEWQDKTLFIDGLDEVIANAGNRTPLNQIRSKLNQLSIKRYRISCRAADWQGERDHSAIERASGEIKVLELQGLTEADIKTILKNDNRINDAEGFYQQAEANQLGNFLSNPQTLDMLIEATAGGANWPTSKQQLYQKVCEVLSLENNQEHADSPASRFITEELLEAAGELYAYMLIANSQSFNTTESEEKDSISLPKLGISKHKPHYFSLRTRLFNQITSTSFNPIHRSVAEFLAAKYLANKLKKGVSLRRCFALITGFDGGPVAALRGLYAWLGTLSIQAREKVIETDVLGLLQYGDVSTFSVGEKIKVIETLKAEAINTGYLRHQNGKGFASLITYEMTGYLKELLSVGRAQVHQSVIDVIMTGLFYSEQVAELKPCLLDILKDKQYDEALRLDALIVLIDKGYTTHQELLGIANAIKNKEVHDETYRLQSYLLTYLYPNIIQPEQLFDYAELSETKFRSKHNYILFWDYEVYKRLRDSDIPALLDALALRNESLTAYRGYDKSLLKLAGELLSKGLTLYGDVVNNEKLYQWLSIGFNKGTNRLEDEAKSTIQAWMQSHSERFLSLFEIGLAKIQTSTNVSHKVSNELRKLYINPPQKMGDWWLNKALQTPEPNLTEECFIRAFWSKKEELKDDNQLLEFFNAWTAIHAQFVEVYKRLTYCEIDGNAAFFVEEKQWEREHQQRREEQEQQLLKHLEAIKEGTAFPAIFESIAAHYATYYDLENLDEARLKEYLCENDSLIEAAKQGLKKVIYREDLPTVDDIFKAKSRNQPYFICLPYLLAISIQHQQSETFIDSLDTNQISLALAFTYSHNGGTPLPKWFNALQIKYPELAANIFIKFMRTMLKAKQPHIQCHAVLDYKKEEHKEKVARLVAIPLLSDYPVKSLADNADCLERLLKIALSDKQLKEQLASMLEEKLSMKSMDVLQRVYWLAAGFLINPTQYQQMLVDYVSSSVEKRTYLAKFIYPYSSDIVERFNLPVIAIHSLIKLIGSIAIPRWTDNSVKFRLVTNEMHNGELVEWLIQKLGEDTSAESTAMITDLIEDIHLSAWHATLKKVQQRQHANRREAEFRHPTPYEVAQTIQQTRPANVADLSAMVLDFLDDLQRDMHSTDTKNYLRFWNENELSNPKKENSCRCYLAEKLKDKYQVQGVQINSEALAADDKRVDIRLTYHDSEKRLNLPVEIKCNSNRELWTAIHQQLIPKYTNEPNTQGRGIYLVVWFGIDYYAKIIPKDGGHKPKAAAELQTRLVATMTPEQQKLIDVFVLDVSKPS